MNASDLTHSPFRTQNALKALAIWVVLMMAAVGIAPTPVAAQSASDEASFIALINQVRAGQGLPPLIQNNELTGLARSWTQSQANGVCPGDDFICHASPLDSGVTQSWTKLGENVGTGPNVSDVMDAFIASPGHYENIIDPAFTHVGVGVVWDGARLYTTHRFMALSSTQATTTTTTTRAPATTAAPTPTTRAPATTAAPTPTTTAPATTAAPTPTTTAPAVTAPVAIPFTPETENTPEPAVVNIAPERAAVLIGALAEISG